MATLKDLRRYATDTVYEYGINKQGDIRLGRQTYSTMRPLFPGDSRPRMYRLAVKADAVAEDQSLTLGITDYADFLDTTATATLDTTGPNAIQVKLSKGDILNFGTKATPLVAVVDQEVVVTDATAGVAVTVLPLIEPIGSTALDTCYTYAMVPIEFAATGGMFDITSNNATANNKLTGYYDLKAVTSRSATSTLSGALISSDYSSYLFQELNRGGRNAYYEVRYYPTIPFQYMGDNGLVDIGFGQGPQALAGVVTSNYKQNSDQAEIMTAEAMLESVGEPEAYELLSNDSASALKFTWA